MFEAALGIILALILALNVATLLLVKSIEHYADKILSEYTREETKRLKQDKEWDLD